MLDLASLPPLPEFSWSQKDVDTGWQPYLDYYCINFAKTSEGRIQHCFGRKALGGFDIAVHYFSQPNAKGSVVLSHGYMDHVGLYNHLLQMLLDAGFDVLAYDLPGHGLSSGEQAGIVNFYYYQKVLRDLMSQAKPNLIQPLYAMGQSTGGTITMDYILHNPEHGFVSQTLLAPLVIPRGWTMIKFKLLIGRYLLRHIPRHFAVNSADRDFLYFLEHEEPLQTRYVKASWVNALDRWQSYFKAAGTSSIKTLIVQGNADGTVQWEYNVPAIKQHFKNTEEVLIESANHHLVKETSTIRHHVFEAVKAFLNIDKV